jgi:hypothetical protein
MLAQIGRKYKQESQYTFIFCLDKHLNHEEWGCQVGDHLAVDD